MALKIVPGISESGNPILEFEGLAADKKAKVAVVGQLFEDASADGKWSFDEIVMIGVAVRSLLKS